MKLSKDKYRELVYAGVLGKIIGVYFGRPIEGWPYQKIRSRFGMVDHYVANEVGVPLHVADDDLAGTFTFINALSDVHEDISRVSAESFGNTWLDYIIENKTNFWWGGIGRSTEHTAFMNLKRGIPAPLSGSAAVNTKGISEQIGAQIFIEALALMCPDDPEKARYLVRQSSTVSHDGIAVEAACFLASLDALAFCENRLDKLLNDALVLNQSPVLAGIVTSVMSAVEKYHDFRTIRDWLECQYGYHLYPGNCHVIPNFALIIACLLIGRDSFAQSMFLCASSGWDTDCNCGNIGTFNAIRLGLSSLNSEYDFRTPIADRFYCVSGDGASCVTDAVIQANRIIHLHEQLYGEADHDRSVLPRFSFDYPGAVQGFEPCPDFPGNRIILHNASENDADTRGLVLFLPQGGNCHVSTPCMWDPEDKQQNYQLIGSPTLYETQTVRIRFTCLSKSVSIAPYVTYYDFNDQIQRCDGPIQAGSGVLQWKIPSLCGFTIKRLGIQVCGNSGDSAIIHSIDWDEAPECLHITGSLRNYDLTGPNMQMNAFTASARQFSFDSRQTFVVSDTEINGTAVIGTPQWKNYRVRCMINASRNDRFGIIVRVKGLRRYYGILFSSGNHWEIIRKLGSEETVLSSGSCFYEPDMDYPLCVEVLNHSIHAQFGCFSLSAADPSLTSGAAGFRVDNGTFYVSDFKVERL